MTNLATSKKATVSKNETAASIRAKHPVRGQRTMLAKSEDPVNSVMVLVKRQITGEEFPTRGLSQNIVL